MNITNKDNVLHETAIITCKEQVLLTFWRFLEVWDFNDFWKRANTMDACLLLFQEFQRRWKGEPETKKMQLAIKDMLKENLQFFQRFDLGGLWADDFGWWGLMAINGYKHLQQMGETELAQAYLELIELCWQYKKDAAYEVANTAKPVPHGCHNGDANGKEHGVKNTVTNALLFLLSARIYRFSLSVPMADKQKYLNMAYEQWLWFHRWFSLDQYEYLKKLTTNGALVQERPLAMYKGSDYQNLEHPVWVEGSAWCGDQGMIVAALADMLVLQDEIVEFKPNVDKKEFTEKTTKYLQQIAVGVQEALIGTSDKLFHEVPSISNFGPTHGNDYLGGRGVLLRYLSDQTVQNVIGLNFAKNIKNTANTIWNCRDKSNNQLQPEYTTKEQDQIFNQQFKELWGITNDTHKWELTKMPLQNKNAVCQAMGLDILTATLRVV